MQQQQQRPPPLYRVKLILHAAGGLQLSSHLTTTF